MKNLVSLLFGLITSGLIGGISLYSGPSSAQFGNLLKDLEKAAKDLEKGIQQDAQPKPNQSQQPQQQMAAQTTPKLAVFQGKWAGAPAWECSEPLVVEADGTIIDSGKKELWNLDSDGDLRFEDSNSGAVYFLSPEKGKLYYSREGSGEDPIELSKCD